MNFINPNINHVFEINDNCVTTIVIENKKLFRKIVDDIYNQMNGITGESIVSNNNLTLSFAKYVELVASIVPFDVNKKTLVTKIISKIENEANNPINIDKTNEILTNIEKYVYELTMEYPCSFEMNKMTIGSILKGSGLDIVDDYDNPLERIVDYFEIIKEFEKDKLFVIINLRCYFDDHDTQLLFNTLISHHIKVLFIDSVSYKILTNEKRYTIDEDLCEF